jgi:hypothetical protein
VAADPFPPDSDPPPSCANLVIRCGGTVQGSTRDCSSDFDAHACFARDATGVDRFHSLRLAQDRPEVRIRLDSDSDLDLWVYDAGLGTCLDWGDEAATLFNATAGRYWVVVDGGSGVADDYTIEVVCP